MGSILIKNRHKCGPFCLKCITIRVFTWKFWKTDINFKLSLLKYVPFSARMTLNIKEESRNCCSAINICKVGLEFKVGLHWTVWGRWISVTYNKTGHYWHLRKAIISYHIISYHTDIKLVCLITQKQHAYM